MKITKRTFWLLFTLGMLFIVPAVLAQGEEPPIQIGDISAARAIAFVAAGLSLLFDYFPKVRSWFDALEVGTKRLITVGAAVVVVGLAFLGNCLGLFSTNLVCSFAGGLDALTGIIYVIIAQQAIHQATKPSERFKATVLKMPPPGSTG